MIIAKAPLRISFTGWWSDLPSFYEKFWWAVISTSIDKYIYITVNKKFDNKIRLSYSKTEEVDNIEELGHQYVKEILKYLNFDWWLEITSIADIPSKWSWLGSSSSFTVAMIHALNAYKWQYISPAKLADEACMIEIKKCGQPIWKQDQYASAFWWLNLIEFKKDWDVIVEPILCLKDTKKRLEDNLIMLYTWVTRSASNILENQNKAMVSDEKKQNIMQKMVKLTYDLKCELENNNLNNFWKILHENWLLKKEMSGWISNDQIDNWYEKAIKAWAEWWKILWAWWWGFLLFYAPKEKHESIYTALGDLKKVKFNFENEWSKIIFVH
ncbi:MAG: hypothetical protein ACD_49C00060G0034 [uncultured bacterium (gcode 4)]|uniref:GHMP kinase N-terminal domain-containing protein n=1 Tax=uncultured bacterium (gcode 4) TaxID=1234023 RepID=K2AWP6_9BACT|nr:MAG: hypothetical protein ACD_49C00060G0034 [uncultured bacterium (gcode 4)]